MFLEDQLILVNVKCGTLVEDADKVIDGVVFELFVFPPSELPPPQDEIKIILNIKI